MQAIEEEERARKQAMEDMLIERVNKSLASPSPEKPQSQTEAQSPHPCHTRHLPCCVATQAPSML